MADVKISQLPAATTPVDGTEVLPIVQSATTKQVSIANLTAGRPMSASSLTLTTPLAVTSGGTGLAAGTSGGIPYYSSTTAITSSAALAANALVIGGGAGVAPSTTTTASGILTFLGTPSSANLAAAVTDETGTGSLVFGTSPTFTTSAIFPAGTVSAPGITTTSDTNTGIYFPAADTVAVATNGTEDMRFTPEGNVTLNSATFSPTTPGTAGNMAMTGTLAMGSSFLRNRIINGDMRIAQRGTTAVTAGYPVDRFRQDASTSAVFSYQQNKNSATPPVGFTNYLGAQVTTAYTPGANTTVLIAHIIEGYNTADFGWGSANAKTVTLSFWVQSSLTGTHSGAIVNSAGDRAYVFSFAISSASTWEYKTITIPGDTTGTWLTDNGTGLGIRFNLGTGTGTFGTTTTGWQAGNYVGLTTAVQVSATLNATFYITGVQLELGSVATPFERRQYGTELMLCQRYYWRIYPGAGNQRYGVGYALTTTTANIFINYPVTMRAAPTGLEQNGSAGDYLLVYQNTATALNAVPTFGSASTQGAVIGATLGSGLTAGDGLMFTANSATSYLGWSAEL